MTVRNSLMMMILLTLFVAGCQPKSEKTALSPQDSLMLAKVNDFAVVTLTTDLGKLTEKEKQMIPLLIEVADIIDNLYWLQTLGDKTAFLDSIKDTITRQFAEINYGPWERLNGNKPFVEGYGEKPAGANFYPADMTKEEFEKWNDPNKTSQYTLILRADDRSLKAVWYHEAYKDQITRAADLLNKAAGFAEDAGLKKYLELRAEAFLTDDYFASDMAWMDMKTNTIDFVIGPIENYEDELFGYKTSYEGVVLAKDQEWSKRLAKFASLLPELQKNLPVDPKYKKEKPGTDSDLNAYDVIYVTGQANKGSKTIAINLPNDEKVQLAKGSRRLQLKNAMKAKFDKILLPISEVLIDSGQRANIKFDAFFSNVMFHEVAHGLGIKNTITGKGNVREALKEKYSSFEEAKADILGLYMTTRLIEMGEIKDITVEDCFITYMAGLFRSVRFGAASAHGKANMMCYNYFEDKGAFERLPEGTYRVNMDKIRTAMNEWAAKVLMIEGDGDYQGAVTYLDANGKIRESLQADLDRLKTARIPVDIVYDQGPKVLGLN
ncbi:MAG TPA: Zn-dependent hydrolase [Bacteroidales bacterium]|nr:Zn-dependent hydrolase [Bacteroidales bacterium]HPS50549.1 Zn-dependent hydrolase [Bacteroidales bacterium]